MNRRIDICIWIFRLRFFLSDTFLPNARPFFYKCFLLFAAYCNLSFINLTAILTVKKTENRTKLTQKRYLLSYKPDKRVFMVYNTAKISRKIFRQGRSFTINNGRSKERPFDVFGGIYQNTEKRVIRRINVRTGAVAEREACRKGRRRRNLFLFRKVKKE